MGGHSSGPSIKSFTQAGIQRLENTELHFEPRYTVELAKPGDRETAAYFARPFTASRGRRRARRRARLVHVRKAHTGFEPVPPP